MTIVISGANRGPKGHVVGDGQIGRTRSDDAVIVGQVDRISDFRSR